VAKPTCNMRGCHGRVRPGEWLFGNTILSDGPAFVYLLPFNGSCLESRGKYRRVSRRAFFLTPCAPPRYPLAVMSSLVKVTSGVGKSLRSARPSADFPSLLRQPLTPDRCGAILAGPLASFRPTVPETGHAPAYPL